MWLFLNVLYVAVQSSRLLDSTRLSVVGRLVGTAAEIRGAELAAAELEFVVVVVGMLEQVVADLVFDVAAVIARVPLSLNEHDDDDRERGQRHHGEHRPDDRPHQRPRVCMRKTRVCVMLYRVKSKWLYTVMVK